MVGEITKIFQAGHHPVRVFVDCTTGEGGHTQALIQSLHPQHVICFDADASVLAVAEQRLNAYQPILHHANFTEVAQILHGVENIDAVLFDLGISKYHYEKSNRGFSFRADEVLDMRINNSGQNAETVINHSTTQELTDIFTAYGEERWSKRIAEVIVAKRRSAAIKSSQELAEIIAGAIPRRFWPKNIHPATRVFQALRIYINRELDVIAAGLEGVLEILSPGGRICVLTYHSLEDRIVKHTFRHFSARYNKSENRPKTAIKIITKKPIVPKIEEIQVNAAARSAKLRAVEKV